MVKLVFKMPKLVFKTPTFLARTWLSHKKNLLKAIIKALSGGIRFGHVVGYSSPWIGCREGAGANLRIPRFLFVFGDAGHAECVDAGGVTVAVAVVPVLGPVPSRPHVDGTKTTASLERDIRLFSYHVFAKINNDWFASRTTVVSHQSESVSSKWELPVLAPSSLELWRKERAKRQLSFWLIAKVFTCSSDLQ